MLLQVASAQAELHSEQQRSRWLETELDAEKQQYQALQLHHLRPKSPERAAQSAWMTERQQLSNQVGNWQFCCVQCWGPDLCRLHRQLMCSS